MKALLFNQEVLLTHLSRRLRAGKKATMADFCRRSGVSRAYLYVLLAGTSAPSEKVQAKLRKTLADV